jgi:hypothetical protein
MKIRRRVAVAMIPLFYVATGYGFAPWRPLESGKKCVAASFMTMV